MYRISDISAAQGKSSTMVAKSWLNMSVRSLYGVATSPMQGYVMTACVQRDYV